ncbi:protein swallow-like [Bradysia coprophila]|uniref:protein swallow-like n=1 Tax=Bradysia coprophila TaxID=38358 RepID=UPI00187DAFF3|nr:protein swallow-like [Bradysia coprophila]
MDCDKRSPSNRYELKYASQDALNTKRRYQHVQSKVKVYIDNLRKEDEERRRVKITRHRSEPSELAEWNKPDQLDQSSTDWRLVLEKKNVECNEMKERLHDMKTYGDTMHDLLNAERLRRKELQKKLDAIRKDLKIVNSCTWSDPGFRGGDQIAENTKIGSRGINTTDDVGMYIEDKVMNNSIEWLGEVGSDEIVADENDKTILLEPVEVLAVNKGMKYRVKKLLRCCTPCVKD